MFSDSNWVLELPFLTVKLLRRLTGILEVPGILREDVKKCWFGRIDFEDAEIELKL
jgi:hypothetical protein